MINRPLILILVLTVFAGCNLRQKNPADKSTLSCILLGYDSIACYYGESDQMLDLKRGNILDTLFMQQIIQAAKENTADRMLQIAIKPTAAPNVGSNVENLIGWLNVNDLQNRIIDTLDEIEKKTFNTISMKDLVSQQGKHPMKLFLPRDSEKEQIAENVPAKDRLVILIYADSGIYAYRGTAVNAGKKYTYQEIRNFLTAEKAVNKHLYVIIKPSESSTYKNTINMLDELVIAGIKKYALMDITGEEKSYLTHIESN